MKYSDEQRIARIKEIVDKLNHYIQNSGISRDTVLSDETVRWTLTTPLYNIGEHAYNLSDDYKKTHADIPWAKISGLRHRLVHDYENTNWTIICDIVFNIIPEFEKQLDK
jgi:uncharacterized protein with HEPN domain